MADQHSQRGRKSSRAGKKSSRSRASGKRSGQSLAIEQSLSDAHVQLLAWFIEHPDSEPETSQAANDQQTLKALQTGGWLVLSNNNQWQLAADKTVVTGTVSLHPDGYGFLNSAQQAEDVYLGRREMSGLMPGDKVLVNRLQDKRRNRFYGELLGIIQRVRQKLVGRVVESGRRLTLLADDPAITEPFRISDPDNAFSPGSMVVARITRYPVDGKAGRVVIERQLDDQHLAGLATEVAVLTHELPYEFPAEVISEAGHFGDSITSEQHSGRKDLRDLPLVTIDGEDARDFDDAVYGAPSSDGWRLLVAIADVSSYVKPGTALDQEAEARGTSVYFPTRVVPMLPETLSNGLCSLRPQVDRLALVCDMQLAATGEVRRSRFYPAIISSHARLTYRQANQLLEQQDAAETLELSASITNSLSALEAIWRCRDQVKVKRGALAFDRQETKFLWNADGTVSNIQPSQRLLTHRLIEEAMIAANVEAAKFLLQQNIPSVLRVHPPPSGDKLTELERMLLMYNIKPTWHDKPTPEDFAQILEQAQQRSDKSIIEDMLLRAQSLAIYKPIEEGKTSGHFALALDAYSHFTSPIRRYPDLLVHRAIYAALDKRPQKPADQSGGDTQRKLNQLAQHCSFTERRAEQASRDVEFRLKCHYLKAFEGKTFEGWITGVKNFGLFVELADLQISGLLHVSNLGSDYYIYDERDLCLYGRRAGNRFNIGDRLSVKLLRVDIEQRKIDFGLE